MQKHNFIRANLLLCLNAVGIQAASAQPRLVVNLSAETRDFGEGRGSLDSAVLEYKVEDGDTTVVFAPTYGERHAASTNYTAAGFDGAIYQRWSDSVSTRSEIFVAEDSPVFAKFDFSQDVTVRIARNDTLTVGARWARYFGGHNVAFQSVGLRHYFPRGSVAYRMTRINPDNRDSFLGHLVNLSINDAEGAGKTQLWLGTGGASFDRVQAEDIVSGNDNSIVIQRYQPVFGKFSLVGTAGLTSYSRPEGRTTGSNFRLGMVVPVS